MTSITTSLSFIYNLLGESECGFTVNLILDSLIGYAPSLLMLIKFIGCYHSIDGAECVVFFPQNLDQDRITPVDGCL